MYNDQPGLGGGGGNPPQNQVTSEQFVALQQLIANLSSQQNNQLPPDPQLAHLIQTLNNEASNAQAQMQQRRHQQIQEQHEREQRELREREELERNRQEQLRQHLEHQQRMQFQGIQNIMNLPMSNLFLAQLAQQVAQQIPQVPPISAAQFAPIPIQPIPQQQAQHSPAQNLFIAANSPAQHLLAAANSPVQHLPPATNPPPPLPINHAKQICENFISQEQNIMRGHTPAQATPPIVQNVPPQPQAQLVQQQRVQQYSQQQQQPQQQHVHGPQDQHAQNPAIHAPQPMQQPIHRQPPPPQQQLNQAPAPVAIQHAAPPREQHRAPPRRNAQQRAPARRRQQPPPPEAPPRVDEALAYLRIIKQTFSSNVPIYHKFLEIMKDFRAQRIETPDVIEQVAELLYESPDLVLGFNTFLPAGYRIEMSGTKYVFNSPTSAPRVLLSPEERRVRAAAADGASADANVVPDAAPKEEDVDEATDDEQMEEEDVEGTEEEENESALEEDEEKEEKPLIEEVRQETEDDDEEEEEEPENNEEEITKGLTARTLNIIELLKSSFTARPDKLVEFVTFLEFFINKQKFYSWKKQKEAENKREKPKNGRGEGSAPPQQNAGESMEVDEEGEAESKPEDIEETTEKIADDFAEKQSGDLMISMLAKVCLGEPELLAAMIDFLPYLQNLLINASDELVQKVRNILKFNNIRGRPDVPEGSRVDPKQVDLNLMNAMQKYKFGTKKNEKLVIKQTVGKPEEKDEELMVLQKSYRIIYEKLKTRTTTSQIKQLMIMFNMYLNMDITAEQMAAEIPKIMERERSEPEIIIMSMLGISRDPKDKPENDVDAVMRKDMPPVQQKIGIRDQKMIQQVRTIDAATVCTLGPSYRLLKGGARGKETFGRIDMSRDVQGVLNDKWTSYPSWSSEDTGSQTVKKSNLEEFHFKTEEERYELDIVVDSNRTIMEELSKTLRNFQTMSEEEKNSFKLDANLNCSYRSTFLRVMTKVFTNSVHEYVEAAQKNPLAGLKKIIDGLQEKHIQWTRFQQEANRTWRDALDKQMSSAMTLLNNQQKNYDQKAFKSKPLVNAIEQVYEERRKTGGDETLPHMTLEYSPEQKVFCDVNEVTGHFFHDLPGGKTEKDRTRVMLFRILMEWLCRPQQSVQIDIDNGEVFKFQGDESEDENLLSFLELDSDRTRNNRILIIPPPSSEESEELTADEKFRQNLYKRERRVFYGDDNVYMIIRYHHMIHERFARILATQSIYSQEYTENMKKFKKWQNGVGADMHGRHALEENFRTRRDAVNDFKNVRSSPSAYYDTTLRELKQLGGSQMDMIAFEDAVKHLFPADVVLFNNIDKLFMSLAKNIHHATCAEEQENPIKLYLKYRKRLMDTENTEEREAVEQEYAQNAEEILRGKNTYRFEFINEQNIPYINIWVIPREEKGSGDEDDDEDGNDDENDDDNEDGKDGGKDDDKDDDKADDDDEDKDDDNIEDKEDDDQEKDEDDSVDDQVPEMPARSNDEDEGEKSVDFDELPGAVGPEDSVEYEEMEIIEQTGCDMEVAFEGKYKYDEVKAIDSRPGETHRIYLNCVRDHDIWLSRTKLTPRNWKTFTSYKSEGIEKVHRSCDYDKINKSRRLRIRRIEKALNRKGRREDLNTWFKRPFVPLIHV